MTKHVDIRQARRTVAVPALSVAALMGFITPVVMTALVAALAPLRFEVDTPGTEILHPVEVVIFSGLITSTLLDSFLTPAMVALFGRNPIEALVAYSGAESF